MAGASMSLVCSSLCRSLPSPLGRAVSMSAVRGLGAVAAGLLLGLVVAVPAQADGVRNQQWYLSSMDLPAVHAITKGTGVIVAVVDSGVDASHPDLTGNVQPGTETAGTRDLDGRGTALASLVAGHGHG